MSTELTEFQGKRMILKKNGMVHWVSEAAGIRLKEALGSQTSHTFYTINEIDITINSSEIDGVYLPSEYIKICNLKQGMWQCAYGQWHEKTNGKVVCRCAQEKYDKMRREAEQNQRRQQEKLDTPEEKEKARERLLRITEESALKGSQVYIHIFAKGNRKGKKIRRQTVVEYEQEHGTVPAHIIQAIEIE